MPYFSSVSERIEQTLRSLFSDISFYALAFLAMLLIASLCRFLLGKRGQIAKALLSATEILCLYLPFFALERFGLQGRFFVRALPFLRTDEGSVQLFCVIGAPLSDICAHLLRLLPVAFAVNLMHTVIPTGKRALPRLLLRATVVVLALAANYLIDTALALWLPQGVGRYAPALLIAAFALLIVLGSLRFLVGAALLTVNPVIAALYTFFFSTLLGRTLARAMLSTALLGALVYLMNVFGILC